MARSKGKATFAVSYRWPGAAEFKGRVLWAARVCDQTMSEFVYDVVTAAIEAIEEDAEDGEGPERVAAVLEQRDRLYKARRG